MASNVSMPTITVKNVMDFTLPSSRRFFSFLAVAGANADVNPMGEYP